LNRKRIASVVSAALNAPLITMITFILLILWQGTPKTPLLIGITSVFGCILPLIMVGVLLKLDLIEDFYAHDKEQRFIPFLWTSLFYLMGAISLVWVDAPITVTALMTCYFVNSLVLTAITFKWKISIHASGITGPVTALVYLLGSTMLPLFLIVIPVAWARVELKAHTKMQVTAGAIISTLLTWFQMSLYMKGIILF
jgi:membrane-associated phospholipid phosphatase